MLLGIFTGWLIFHPSSREQKIMEHKAESVQSTIWTCAMHPQIRMDQPGKCPICGMDLIPLVQTGKTFDDSMALHLTKEAAALAQVHTTIIRRQNPVSEIRLYGKVQADERLLKSQSAHVSGRIERLHINFTGEQISAGQVLATIFSPELITAQQELLEAVKLKDTQPAIYEAAREKLRQWKLTDKQIYEIENKGEVRTVFDIISNTNGIVTSKLVKEGDYVTKGSILFEIVDLSKVWILFDAYESDLPFIKINQKVTFQVHALPGKNFSGIVTFIDPLVDPITRVVKLRVEAENNNNELKPGMFVTGVILSSPPELQNSIAVPRSAVLWTGKRSIVYVKMTGIDEPVFKMREILLGPLMGDLYIVTDGLSEGEEIVTNGVFSIDAAAQLEGKPSMMNPVPEVAVTGHNHSNMSEISRQKEENVFEHSEFHVSGNCEMCKERIETAAKSVKGVISAQWDIESKLFHVTYNSSLTNVKVIQKAIADVGHDNDGYRAPDEVYEKLPQCCLYRK